MMKSMRLIFAGVGWAALSLVAVTTTAHAQQASGNDLRDIRIGMGIGDLPTAGYVNFACANDQGHAIAAWSDWSKCPAANDGLHAIRFDYDPSTSREGTIVAGHPALLTLLVDDKGTVAGLRIETDPKARLYLRKKAFLFGMQVKSRYGTDGWTCQEAQPENGEQSVGGVYINESCRKTIHGRSITVRRALYRRADQDMKSFVDKTSVLIQRSQG
jgi:hypothetical protein